ncbi:hypothetical protein [Rhodococcoides yunnanense]|uniref:hypothetical protein n=1 Tax=Rhodococcoides yunnanense TaxID=278209 RepID=UPI000932543B|nr:hypothetical protein [Rhodococcus yunnanensis]
MTPTQQRTTNTRRRILETGVLTTAITLAATGVAHAQTIPNPLDNINPDVGLLGPALNSTWKRVVAAIWGGCLVVISIWVITSALKAKKSRGRGVSSDLSEASEDFRLSLMALGAVAGASVIIGAVLFLVGG